MVSKKVFLAYSKPVTLTFTPGWITNVTIAAYTRNTATRVHAMGWKFTICHFWIKTTKRDPLALDWRKVSHTKYYNYAPASSSSV